MNDQDLRTLLRRTPRAEASPGFKTRVLARIEERSQRRRSPMPLFAFGIVAAVLLIAAPFAWRQRIAQEQEQVARQRVESMQHEYRDLEAELRQLRRFVAESQPIVGVEGGGEVDFVLDLQELSQGREGKSIPVSYRFPQ